MSAPTPETVVLCTMCHQPWEKHVRLAYWRLSINEDDEMPTEQEVEEAISFLECIYLLKEASVGPQGPAGPQGPMGIQGRSA